MNPGFNQTPASVAFDSEADNMSESDNKENIARLDERTKVHGEFIDEMRSNHLPHIYQRLGGIEKRIAYYTGGIGAALGILQTILTFFVK